MSQTILSQSEIGTLESLVNQLINKKTTNSLSSLLNEQISYKLNKIQQIDFTDFEKIIPSFHDTMIMSGVYVSCEGDLRLGILFYYPDKQGTKIAAKMLQQSSLDVDAVMERSCLVEMGNILAASLFNAINDSVGSEMLSTVPGFALDNLRGMVEYPAMDIGQSMTKLVILDGELSGDVTDTKIGMMIFQEPNESKKILTET